MDVHRSCMELIEKQKKPKTELTQSQKVTTLAHHNDRVEFWIDPMDRVPHVSIMVKKHCENYRVDGGGLHVANDDLIARMQTTRCVRKSERCLT